MLRQNQVSSLHTLHLKVCDYFEKRENLGPAVPPTLDRHRGFYKGPSTLLGSEVIEVLFMDTCPCQGPAEA